VTQFYPWLVFVHLVGLVVFVATHGVSMLVAFRVRRERDRRTIATLLELSGQATQASYLGLIVLGIGGLGAAWVSDQLLRPWVVASYVVVVAVLVGMFSIAPGYYYPLREAISGAKGASPIGDDELVARLRTRRPEALALIGGIGLAVLLWLMVLKPG
jgi:hypothetical protein